MTNLNNHLTNHSEHCEESQRGFETAFCFKIAYALGLIVILTLSTWQQANAREKNRNIDESTFLAETTRGSVANQLHLMAADLLDELVYRWTENPIVPKETPVILLNLNVPLGLNQSFAAILEDHFIDLVHKNPQTLIRLIYCGACTALTVTSDGHQTIMGQGYDLGLPPNSLAAKNRELKALSLDFSLEGAELVLRARISSLAPQRELLAATTLATSSSSPPLLRSADHIISAQEAREEYVSILEQRPQIEVPIRMSVEFLLTQGSQSQGSEAIVQPPMVWLQTGIETWITRQRRWTGGVFMGVSSIPRTYDAWSLGSRVQGLLGHSYSLSTPNFYTFLELSYYEISGVSAIYFNSDEELTPRDIIDRYQDRDIPLKATGGRIKLGFEMRLRQFYRAEVFVETLPGLEKNKNFAPFSGVIHGWGFGMGVTL